jgi:hypothetical protein
VTTAGGARPREMSCDACAGTGYDSKRECPACRGQTIVDGKDCAPCNGSGALACEVCAGAGVVADVRPRCATCGELAFRPPLCALCRCIEERSAWQLRAYELEGELYLARQFTGDALAFGLLECTHLRADLALALCEVERLRTELARRQR